MTILKIVGNAFGRVVRLHSHFIVF